MIRRSALVALAVALVTVVLSACAFYKPESFKGSQPEGIGPVNLHLSLCTQSETEEICAPSNFSDESQQILAFAVPKGSSAPQNFSVTPTSTGPTLRFALNQNVSQAAAALPPETGKPAWPPAGDEVVGYLSDPYVTHEGEDLEWRIDAGFGLPSGSDGGSFNSIYTAGLVTGARSVDESLPASRPLECEESDSFCEISDEATVPVSDLKISAESSTAAAFVGGEAQVPFKLDFASTVSGALPSFSLTATTSVPGGAASPTEASFAPSSVDGASHRTAASRAVAVKIPASTAPGTYQVNLTATNPAGGAATGIATVVVSKPTIKFGKLKLNKSKGTGVLSVTASSAGKLSLSGKGLAKATTTVAAAGKPVKLTVRPTGKGLKKLSSTGKLKAKAKISLKPSSGITVTKNRSLTLKLNG